MFNGQSVQVQPLGDGLYELCFDRQNEAINKLDMRTLREITAAVATLAAAADLRGVLITSAKAAFIVGADITEFGKTFALASEVIVAANMNSHLATNAIEDLGVPTVVAINGFALGGGLELAMAADFRVMSNAAQIGLPEVNLGLFPGLGGTVRLPRIASPAVAVDWIGGGAPRRADAALAAGVVDRVESPEALREAALTLLKSAIAGGIDWQLCARRKTAAIGDAPEALSAVFGAAKAGCADTVAKHQPAALAAIELMERSVHASRAEALSLEAHAFARIAKSQAAASLVQIFLNDQYLKKRYRQYALDTERIARAAVLGAGIMGGGIAYTSAVRGIPTLLKDVRQEQLDLGMAEAAKLLAKQVKSRRIDQAQADRVAASITAQLGFEAFDTVNVVIEAVTENLKLKHAVLVEVEAHVARDAIIATNTSSLRVDELAKPLSRPENFVGMHFFNPVPVMPLVEVIRGAATGAAAVSIVVGYAVAMGKTPIVVRDGPGFLVNRVLTPYMLAFSQLVADGIDFVRIDDAMQAFGWPMGPAYLNDVVGMDTGAHVFDVICAGYPERMVRAEKDALREMVERHRFGQKTGVGFYRYRADDKGRMSKEVDAQSHEILRSIQPHGTQDLGDSQIVERMMLPMICEAACCIEDGTVDSPQELDMALLLGLGFPKYLGGALKYADWLGLDRVVELSDRHAGLGLHYRVPQDLRERAVAGRPYYGS